MKKSFISAVMALCLVVLLFGLAPHAKAERVTTDIFYLDEISHMLVTVEFTAEAPQVHFLAPDGTKFDDNFVKQGLMHKEVGDKALVYRIPNAASGQWQIVYDKGSNENLTITWAPYAEPVSIQSFSFQSEDSAVEAKLHVNYVRNAYYTYTILAALTDENGQVTGTKELKTGTALANQTETIYVDISSLPTYSGYRLVAQVVLKDSGMQVEDSVVAEQTFDYVNPNMPEPLKGVYLEIGVDDDSLLVDWTKYAVLCNGYTVAVFADGQELFIGTYEPDTTATKITLDPTFSRIQVQIVYTTGSDDRVSQVLVREVDLSHRQDVTVEAEEISSKSNVKIHYDFSALGGDIQMVVKVNDKSQEATVSGSGTMAAALEMFENKVYLYWYLDEDTAFVAQKTFYYDNIAPLLVLPELTAEVETSANTYVLVGYTELGCTVTVDGQTVALDEIGAFSVTLSLKGGKNTFTVTAENALGNSSVQTFTVTCTAAGMAENGNANTVWAKIQGYLPMIFTFIMSIVLMVLVLILPNGFAKRKESKGKKFAIGWLISNVLLYLSAIAAGVAGWWTYRYIADCKLLNNMDFFETANTSVMEAYKQLQQNNFYKVNMICWLCAFAVLLLAGIGLMMLPKFRKKEEKQAETPEMPAQPAAEEPAQPEAPSENTEEAAQTPTEDE